MSGAEAFPTQSKVQREPGLNLPVVLDIGGKIQGSEVKAREAGFRLFCIHAPQQEVVETAQGRRIGKARRCIARRGVAESNAAALRKIVEAVELISARVKSETQQVLPFRDRKVVGFIEGIERPAAVVIDTGSEDQRPSTADNQLVGIAELRQVAAGSPDVRECNGLGRILREKESAESKTGIIYDVGGEDSRPTQF